MGLFSAIGSFFSGVVSAIAGALSGPVGMLFTALTVLVNLPGVLDAVSKLLHEIGKALGLVDDNDDMAELGYKATQSGVKKSEEFESTEAYIEYLRNDIELNREQFGKMSEQEKSLYAAAGVAIVASGIEEKTGVQLPAEFLADIGKTNARADEIMACIESFAEAGLESMGSMTEALSGTLDGKDVVKVTSAIADGLKSVNPSMSADEVFSRMNEIGAPLVDKD